MFDPPTGIEAALADLESLFESPSLTLLGEGVTHLAAMRQVLLSGRPAGSLLHDAHIAALLVESGVREFWTEDRDFARFPGLKIVHPFA